MEEIQARLNRLEADLSSVRRQNAMLRLAMVAAFAVWFLIGPSSPKPPAVFDVIRAKKLEIVDNKGNLRAELTMLADVPALWLYDENRAPRAGLYALPDGPGLALSDEKGKVRAVLSVDAHGPGLAISDGNGKLRAGLLADANGPSMWLYDERGKVIWQAPPK